MAAKTSTTQERIGRVGQRRQVVIPREMLATLKIQEGDFVAFSQQANGVMSIGVHDSPSLTIGS
jgi:bifunctional DNA-binding transcriptional regulator/antitoxin component of YhaV-PrlF toxin-antitoxin module